MKSLFKVDGVSSDGIGLARFLYFGIILLTVPAGRLAAYGLRAGACELPYGVREMLELFPSAVAALPLIFQVFAVCAAIGLFTELSMWAVFASLLILNLFVGGYCYYDPAVAPIHVGTFLWALLDRRSSFRLDRLFWKSKTSIEIENHNALMPILFRLHFGIVFFLSGFTKLRLSGFTWATTDSLSHILTVQNFALEGRWFTREFVMLNAFVAGLPWLSRGLAWLTLATELGAPLAVFNTRLRNWIVLDLALMQIAIFVLMYINFAPWAALYIFWLPLGEIASRIESTWTRFVRSRLS